MAAGRRAEQPHILPGPAPQKRDQTLVGAVSQRFNQWRALLLAVFPERLRGGALFQLLCQLAQGRAEQGGRSALLFAQRQHLAQGEGELGLWPCRQLFSAQQVLAIFAGDEHKVPRHVRAVHQQAQRVTPRVKQAQADIACHLALDQITGLESQAPAGLQGFGNTCANALALAERFDRQG